MKAQTLFVCTLLFLGAFALTEDEEAIQTLQKINASKFGHTLLDSIQLQLEAGDAVDNLLDMLSDIESNLMAEQKEDDSYIKDLRGSCEADESRLSNEIAAALNRIDELTAELNEKIPTRDEKVTLLGQRQQQSADTTDEINSLDDARAEKDQEWQDIAAEHDRATFVIESAKQFIDRGFAGSFLEKSSNNVFVDLSNHFTKSADLKFKKKSWNHMFKLLATISSAAPVQADRSSIDKIVELCDNLLEKIADSREIERRSYDSWVARYNDDRARAVAKLDELTLQISTLNGEISALNKRIAIATDEREEQRQRVTEKKAELKDREKYCDDERESYTKRREERHENLEVVSNCIGLIESKVRLLKQFVAQRLG